MAYQVTYAVVSIEGDLIKCHGVYSWVEALGVANAVANVLDLSDAEVVRISPLREIEDSEEILMGYEADSYDSEYGFSASKRTYILKNFNTDLPSGQLLESSYVAPEPEEDSGTGDSDGEADD